MDGDGNGKWGNASGRCRGVGVYCSLHVRTPYGIEDGCDS